MAKEIILNTHNLQENFVKLVEKKKINELTHTRKKVKFYKRMREREREREGGGKRGRDRERQRVGERERERERGRERGGGRQREATLKDKSDKLHFIAIPHHFQIVLK